MTSDADQLEVEEQKEDKSIIEETTDDLKELNTHEHKAEFGSYEFWFFVISSICNYILFTMC